MLKAIWPSLRTLVPNYPEGSNITTLGMVVALQLILQLPDTPQQHKNHVLLHLLVDPTPLHLRLSAQDPLAIPRQSAHRPTLLASPTRLVVH